MIYSYIVLEVKPEKLQEELCNHGADGWELIIVIPLQRIKEGFIELKSQPNIELTYQLIMKIECYDKKIIY